MKIEYAVTRNEQIDNMRFDSFLDAVWRAKEISCVCFTNPQIVVYFDGVIQYTKKELERLNKIKMSCKKQS